MKTETSYLSSSIATLASRSSSLNKPTSLSKPTTATNPRNISRRTTGYAFPSCFLYLYVSDRNRILFQVNPQQYNGQQPYYGRWSLSITSTSFVLESPSRMFHAITLPSTSRSQLIFSA
jgi:hypothetical protein